MLLPPHKTYMSKDGVYINSMANDEAVVSCVPAGTH